MSTSRKIIISACLAGIPCRYDGSHRAIPELCRLVREGEAVPVCPEILGGLATPRPPAEIRGGDGCAVIAGSARVSTLDGNDLSEAYLAGAAAMHRFAAGLGCKTAVLKDRSPSCGVREIYDGSFAGALRPGSGVAACYLRSRGIEVLTADEFLPNISKRNQ